MMVDFIRFEEDSAGTVAVFMEGLDTFRLNTVNLKSRIRSLIKEQPGYCPDSDNAVLVELRIRNNVPPAPPELREPEASKGERHERPH